MSARSARCATLAPKVSLVRAVAGMVPDGRRDLNPALNTIHTLTAVEAGGTWRVAMFQSTPAAFHGRPDLAQALTEELRALLPKAPAAAGPAGAERAMTRCRQHRAMDCRQPRQGNASSRCRSSAIRTRASCRATPASSCRRACAPPWARPATARICICRFAPSSSTTRWCTRSAPAALQQVVILAAGMDTRAFRIPWPSGVKVFEVDRDEIFDHKEAVLGRAGASPSCDRHVVRADLARPWTAALAAAGFERSKPAAFLVEGLLMYLDEAEALALLAAIGRIAAPGSWLAADVVNPEVMTSPYMARYMTALREAGSPWKFGIEDPESFFRQRGWTATVVQPGDPEASYGRWPFPTAPRAMPGLPRTFFVTAARV